MSNANGNLRIMVVDDSPTIRRTAETLLSKEGYEVTSVEDGLEALCKVAEVRPDVIFMDVMMPKLDGYDTCQVIKASADFSETLVIMLSSKDGIFDRARGKLAGSEAFISKPFSRDELLSVIETHYGAH